MQASMPVSPAGLPAERMAPTYPVWVRLCHLVNIVALVVMATSGLQIFNAHPVLYAADDANAARTVLSLPQSAEDDDRPGQPTHMTLLGHEIATGTFALDAVPPPLAQGGWLEGARRIHFTAAWVFVLNGLLYLALMVARRRRRAVWPGRADLPLVWPAIRDHLRVPPVLHSADGGLNPLQKMAYLAIPGLLAPFVIATGLALSPQWDAMVPWWTDLFGGRQFARTWHFVAMLGFFGFIAGHLLLVAISGPSTWAKMVTGGKSKHGRAH